MTSGPCAVASDRAPSPALQVPLELRHLGPSRWSRRWSARCGRRRPGRSASPSAARPVERSGWSRQGGPRRGQRTRRPPGRPRRSTRVPDRVTAWTQRRAARTGTRAAAAATATGSCPSAASSTCPTTCTVYPRRGRHQLGSSTWLAPHTVHRPSDRTHPHPVPADGLHRPAPRPRPRPQRPVAVAPRAVQRPLGQRPAGRVRVRHDDHDCGGPPRRGNLPGRPRRRKRPGRPTRVAPCPPTMIYSKGRAVTVQMPPAPHISPADHHDPASRPARTASAATSAPW